MRRPLFSVIVPTFNESANIGKLLASLEKQTLPSHEYEIIIVDNNSTDDTLKIAKGYPCRVYREKRPRNADAARNLGADRAKGDWIAFTDADCLAHQDWLTNACLFIKKTETRLFAGRIRFILGNAPSAAQLFDSVTNLQHETSVRERGIAFTANLFVQKELFLDLGGFCDSQPMGGDARFTHLATREGHRLWYSPNVVVDHPARNMLALGKKAFRIGSEKGRLALHEIGENRLPSPGLLLNKTHFKHLGSRGITNRLKTSNYSLSIPKILLMRGCGLLYLTAGAAGLGNTLAMTAISKASRKVLRTINGLT